MDFSNRLRNKNKLTLNFYSNYTVLPTGLPEPEPWLVGAGVFGWSRSQNFQTALAPAPAPAPTPTPTVL